MSEEPEPYVGRYAAVVDLREQAKIDDAVDDQVLERALKAAEDQIDRHCRRGADGGPRPFTAPDLQEDEPSVREFRPRGGPLKIDDVVEVQLVEVRHGDAWTAVATYDLEPLGAVDAGQPYTRVMFTRPVWTDRVRITGWWGWPQLPDVVVQATLLQASRLAQRRNAAFGVAPTPSVDGTGMRLLAKLDADVELLLAPLRRNTVLV